jgi:hypothetical protein
MMPLASIVIDSPATSCMAPPPLPEEPSPDPPEDPAASGVISAVPYAAVAGMAVPLSAPPIPPVPQ